MSNVISLEAYKQRHVVERDIVAERWEQGPPCGDMCVKPNAHLFYGDSVCSTCVYNATTE